MQNTRTEQNSGFFARLLFLWVNPLIQKGQHNALADIDLFELNSVEDSLKCSSEFRDVFALNQQSKRPVIATLWKLHRSTYVGVCLLALVYLVCSTANPLLIREIILFLKMSEGGSPELNSGINHAPLSQGLVYAFALLLSVLIANIGNHHLYHISLKIGMRMRAGMVVALYRKALRLTPEARLNSSTGEIVNLMANDAARIYNIAAQLHSLWLMPVQMIVIVALLFSVLGSSMFAGLAVMLLMMAVSAGRAKKMMQARKKLLGLADARVSLMSEILNGIRVIKFYAWEKSFLKNVGAVRTEEHLHLRRLARELALVSVLFLSTPVFVGLATFATHLLMGRTLNAPDVFAALAFFGILRPVMAQLPMTVSSYLDANIAAKRMEDFFAQPEIEPRFDAPLPKGSVRFENAFAGWKAEAPFLKNLNLEIVPGECVAIVGSVGAGKSLLLAAMLGELKLQRGRFESAGTLAYVSQQAWIVNASVRENIVFGLEFDAEKYARCLHVCALESDIAQLPAGDLTEIGERGVNLSGGQKQRLSLARAVYSDADIYLLDDPLSAVDSAVGQHIFNECIAGVLKNKTRILVTHRLEYAMQASRIVQLEKGLIADCGTPAQVLMRGGELATLLSEYQKDHATPSTPEQEKSTHLPVKPGPSSPAQVAAPHRAPRSAHSLVQSLAHSPEANVAGAAPKSDRGRLVVDEERFVGAVRTDIYRVYFKALAPGALLLLLFGAFALREIFTAGNDSWLAYFSSSQTISMQTFLVVFGVLGVCATLATYLRSILTTFGGVRAAQLLHEKLLQGVLRAPMGFFESTPSGRVLNRFGKDMEVIDQFIPNILLDALGCIFTIFSTLLVICVATPLALFVLVPAGFVYFRVQKLFRLSSREIKRLESISRSPVYAHFSESLAGATTIRAFGAEERFTLESVQRFEGNQRAFYTMISLNRWLGTRLEFLGALVVFSAVVFAVLARHQISPGLAGLSVTYALMVTGALNWAVRMVSELESIMNAVERVTHYSTLAEEKWEGQPAPAHWPSKGHIKIEDLYFAYRPDLPCVLNGISCEIAPGEKIGVVGRTGAGKSSLFLALYRIVEPRSGRITIDGIDISTLSLSELRSSLSIIPQDPVLFLGTIRSNLDPFSQYSEVQLNDALRRAHMAQPISLLPRGLDSDVKEGGSNLSVGQRQLLCLARALLKQAKIVLMDEATASVDFETDTLIQETVRTEFKHATVITIAHRLNTVRDAHRILLLDAGKIANSGPTSMLEDLERFEIDLQIDSDHGLE